MGVAPMRVSNVSIHRVQPGSSADGGKAYGGVETTTLERAGVFRGLAKAHTTTPLHPLKQDPRPELMLNELITNAAPGAEVPSASVSTGWTESTSVLFDFHCVKPLAVTVAPLSILALFAANTSAYLKVLPVRSSMLPEK